MLKCDKDVDFSKEASVLFEPKSHLNEVILRDRLVKRAKQRQIENLMFSSIEQKKSDFATL